MFQFPQNEDWTTQIAALKNFLTLWYEGSIDTAKNTSHEPPQTLNTLLPPPLTALYEFVGKDQSDFFPQNRLLSADDIDLDAQVPVFYIENQGVNL